MTSRMIAVLIALAAGVATDACAQSQNELIEQRVLPHLEHLFKTLVAERRDTTIESLTPIGSGDSLHVIRENVIDECLIADVSPFGFLTQTAQYISIESDCNELSGLVTKRRPPHTPH